MAVEPNVIAIASKFHAHVCVEIHRQEICAAKGIRFFQNLLSLYLLKYTVGLVLPDNLLFNPLVGLQSKK